LIYMEEPFIVPGGRFREVYYWDSYWTILGLLVSGMHDTVKGMLQNFADLVDQFGLIPNGNRVYYTRRSQPPLYIAMVEEYYKATDDTDFVKKILGSMSDEFNFWIKHRSVVVHKDGKDHTMARYNVEVDMPRPEGYVEDYRLAQEYFETVEDKQEIYMNLKTGAESGLDYSTKWFIDDDGTVSVNLDDIKARHIVPVELNAYLCRNARFLSELHTKFGDADKARQFKDWEDSFKTAINEVLWDDDKGSWFDYDIQNNKLRDAFFATNIAPLWANCYVDTKHAHKAKKMVRYIDGDEEVGQYALPNSFTGGIPTSLLRSGEQWDQINIWPPMQELVATAMENTGLEQGKRVATDIVNKYLQNVYCNFETEPHTLYEKYASEFYCGLKSDKAGGSGGEYEVQKGFGWTNGVALYFLEKYGDTITTTDSYRASASSITSHLALGPWSLVLLRTLT